MRRDKEEINAFLGKDTEFEGKLSFAGAVRIDGRFRGEITKGETLIVGENAIVDSDIYVSRIIIKGEVRGNIHADERVEIYAPARVTGNLKTPILVVDEGVLFDGSCKMEAEAEGSDKGEKVARFPQ
jgi:cytoskeletal protein CcmA (bactofilin family)